MAGPLCGSPKQQGEGTCTKPAGWRTEHPGFGRCYFHGGTSPSHNRAADKQKLRNLALTYGEPQDISPGDLMLRELRYSAGHVAWIRQQIQALQASALTWGDAEHIHRVGGNDAAEEIVQRSGANVLIQLYDSERKLMAEMARIVFANDIDRRRLDIEELQAGAYLLAIDRIVDAILDPLVLAQIAQVEVTLVARMVQAARSIAARKVPEILVLTADAAERDDGPAMGTR